MAYEYEVTLSTGEKYTVSTPHHHDDHHPDDFTKHLLDIIKGAAGGILSSVIVQRFIFKGKK